MSGEPNHLSRLQNALHEACSFLEEREMEYALAGGLAVAVWGQPRATFDVDLVVAADTDGLARLRCMMQPPVFVFDEPEYLDLPPMTKVLRGHIRGERDAAESELIVVDFLTFDAALTQSILARRRQVETAGRQLWVCSPEDLVLIKLLSSRAKDLEDIRGILAAQQNSMDIDYLEDFVGRLGCREAWQKVREHPDG